MNLPQHPWQPLKVAASQQRIPPSDKAWSNLNRKLKKKAKQKRLNLYKTDIVSVILIALLSLVTVVVIIHYMDKREIRQAVETPINQNDKNQGG